MASLFVIQGRDQGRRFELTDAALVIGRDQTNPLQLHDSEVSRRHAEIRQTDEGFAVVDLQSSNGTFVNNQKVERHLLRSGDRLLCGRTLLLFTEVEDPSSSNLLDEVGRAHV